MRYACVFIFLTFFINLASNAAQKTNPNVHAVKVKTSTITTKNSRVIRLILPQENEAVRKDLIPNRNLKTLKGTFFLLIAKGFIFPKNKNITIQTAIQKLKNNHLPLFKILYQKHFFW